MMSESCSNSMRFFCILRQIEYGVFSRPDTMHLTPASVSTLLQFRDDLVGEVGALLAQEAQALHDRGVGLRIDLREGEVLELVLDLVHAHALGERGIDLQRLERDAAALLRVLDVVDGLHVVQTVRQLHQQHADVVGHRQHQLAEILRVLGVVGLKLQARQLRHAIDQLPDLLAETLLDLVEGRVGVLDRVVQQAGDDGGGIELEPGQDLGDAERMREIGIAGRPRLRAMGLHGKNIGAVEQVLIRAWVVGLYTLDQLKLPNHGLI